MRRFKMRWSALMPWLERFGAVDYVRDQAARYARQARDCLTPLRMSPARERLEALADFVVRRRH